MTKTALFLALVAAACQGNPPEKPAQALDPANPKSLAQHVIFNTRTQKSYETRFKARIAAPKGDPIDYDGRCVWVAPGILYIHYKASGADEKSIVRVGKVVWIYNLLLEDWYTADDMGMPGAGRGIQNPDEVLAVLGRHLETAALKSPGVVSLAFTGGDIEKIMREQAQSGAFDWKESKAALELHADADHRLKKFTCSATLTSSDPNVKGSVAYTAEFELVGYNGATELKFAVPLSDVVKKAIETVQKEKR